MIMSESVKTILPKLFKVQGILKPITKDASNPAFKSKYATLGAVLEEVMEPLREAGLYLGHSVACHMTGMTIGTRVTDVESGEWVELPLGFTLPDMSPQKVGSAITYGRRYGITTLLGLVTEDDDGNAASGKPMPPPALTNTKPAIRVSTTAVAAPTKKEQ